MIPRKPTQEELEDIFRTPEQDKARNDMNISSNDYTYAISVLRTEYEKLEDRLEMADKYKKEYGLSTDEEKFTEIINKLNELNKTIEYLKGVD